MIDKIIEELEKVAKENLGYASSNITEQEMKSYCDLCLSEVEEIIKKHKNDGWIDANDALPIVETSQFNKIQYLCAMESGFYQVLSYCEGWNCFRDYNGNTENINEIFGVLAWKEIKPYIIKGDN